MFEMCSCHYAQRIDKRNGIHFAYVLLKRCFYSPILGGKVQLLWCIYYKISC